MRMPPNVALPSAPVVAVVFEPAVEIVFRALRRQRRELAGWLAHRDERALLADQNVGARHPRRHDQSDENKAGSEQTHSRLPERQPDAAGEHQREGDRRDFAEYDRPRPAARRPRWRTTSCRRFPTPSASGRATSSPNGINTHRHQRRRHHDDVADRNGDHVRQHGVLLALMKIVSCERRDRDAGDQRRRDDFAEEL